MSKIRLHGSSSGYVEIAPAATASNNTLTAPNTIGEIIAKDAAGAIGVTSVHTTNVVVTGTTKVGAAVTISESGIEASGIGITCANINGTQIGGRRNLIINGGMNIAQRGISTTTSGYATVDRFKYSRGGLDEAPTQEQATLTSAPGPYREGHRKAYKITNGNQTSGGAVGDYILLDYFVEARDIATSGWDYIKPESFITLSFWVKSSVAQNFYGSLRSMDGTSQNYPFETGSLTADTWKKVVLTIPGNSNLQFDNNNDQGLRIRLAVFRGTNATGSVTLNQWAAFNTNTQYPDNTTTWYTTNDATFFITGVQLEVGTQATPFEHRSFAEELNLCKRYYQKSYAYGTTAGTPSSILGCVYNRYAGTVTNRMDLNTRFEVEMRTIPSVIAYSPSAGTADRVDDNGNGTGDTASAVNTVSSLAKISTRGIGGLVSAVAFDNVGSYHYTADAEM